MNVLLADDNEGSRVLLTRLLEAKGYSVRAAVDGRQALEWARNEPPDLIVSDILMPELDGYALCRAVKKDAALKQIPFVFYTATFVEPEDEMLAMDLGASLFVAKPAEPDAFMAAVERVMDEHRQGRPPQPAQVRDEPQALDQRYEDRLSRKLQQKVRELQESEQRQRRIIETVPDILFTLDPHTRAATYISPAVQDLLGYSPEELLGDARLWQRVVQPQDLEGVLQAMDAALARGEIARLEGRMAPRDGSEYRWFEARLSVERDEQGRPAAVFGVLTDVDNRRRLEQERAHNSHRLENALIQTVEAVARTVEKRDPYTAGHQRRVAELAAAIAREMGLESRAADGIYLGGLVHDMGKIYVPAEILNRPGKLSPTEMDVVRTHPRVGYDIIKDVDMPWPVARMVAEHHERLDGSGYPGGLEGEAICIEARIMAVADVVEAISSHRPYRPGLGIDVALEEISSHAGTHYDPEAVQACVRLLREKSFAFSADSG